MRALWVAVLGLTVTGATYATQPTALAVLGCGKQIRTINLSAGTVYTENIADLPANQGGCRVWDALPLPGNQAVVLVNTQQDAVPESKGTFELHRYAMPAWRLEAKRALPGKLPHDNYLLPSEDKTGVLVVSLSDETHKFASVLAYQISGVMEPLAANKMKPQDYVGEDDPALPLLRAGAATSKLPKSQTTVVSRKQATRFCRSLLTGQGSWKAKHSLLKRISPSTLLAAAARLLNFVFLFIRMTMPSALLFGTTNGLSSHCRVNT